VASRAAGRLVVGWMGHAQSGSWWRSGRSRPACAGQSGGDQASPVSPARFRIAVGRVVGGGAECDAVGDEEDEHVQQPRGGQGAAGASGFAEGA
jgi:hypothetical protein